MYLLNFWLQTSYIFVTIWTKSQTKLVCGNLLKHKVIVVDLSCERERKLISSARSFQVEFRFSFPGEVRLCHVLKMLPSSWLNVLELRQLENLQRTLKLDKLANVFLLYRQHLCLISPDFTYSIYITLVLWSTISGINVFEGIFKASSWIILQFFNGPFIGGHY